MTLSQRWGRLLVSINYALRPPATPRSVAKPTVTAGVDLGVADLGDGRHHRPDDWRRNTDRIPESGPAQGDADRAPTGRS